MDTLKQAQLMKGLNIVWGLTVPEVQLGSSLSCHGRHCGSQHPIPQDTDIHAAFLCDHHRAAVSSLGFQRLPAHLASPSVLSGRHSSSPVGPARLFQSRPQGPSVFLTVTAWLPGPPCILLVTQSCSLILICQGSYIRLGAPVYDTEWGNEFLASLPYAFTQQQQKYKR